MHGWLVEHRRGLALVSGLAALSWIAVAWQPQVPRSPVVDGPATVAPAPAVRSTASAPSTSRQGDAAPATDAPPAGVTRAQWQALQAEMRTDPNGAAELARIADYLAWSDLLRRFSDTRDDATERQRLARAIDAGLPARLHAGEVSAAEARQIKSALLDVTLADPAERAAALQRWVADTTTPATPDPRQPEFDRRQSAIVAAWSAQPAQARDPAALERQLDALRQDVFGKPATSAR
jgi:hypothetical protein